MPADDRPLTDEELLALLQQSEAAQARVRDAVQEAEEDADVIAEAAAVAQAPDGEPCPRCAEPALALEECHACGEEGCLPRDDWIPGRGEPCITRCARCGMHVHVGCAYADEAGNAVCCGPRAADDYEAYGP